MDADTLLEETNLFAMMFWQTRLISGKKLAIYKDRNLDKILSVLLLETVAQRSACVRNAYIVVDAIVY